MDENQRRMAKQDGILATVIKQPIFESIVNARYVVARSR